MTTANVEDGQATAWIPGDDTFGARLALVRQRMGWGNVAEAAQACGIPVPSWRNWERDGRQPRDVVDIAAKIAERTGCDYMWLLSGRGGRLLVTAGHSPKRDTAYSPASPNGQATGAIPHPRRSRPPQRIDQPKEPVSKRRPVSLR